MQKPGRMFAAAVLLLLLTAPLLSEAGVSLGIKSAWSSLQRALHGKHRGPHITVHYPSGAVREYLWPAVRPLLWSYVCRYCAYVPQRCDGDLAYCKINLRRVSFNALNSNFSWSMAFSNPVFDLGEVEHSVVECVPES